MGRKRLLIFLKFFFLAQMIVASVSPAEPCSLNIPTKIDLNDTDLVFAKRPVVPLALPDLNFILKDCKIEAYRIYSDLETAASL